MQTHSVPAIKEAIERSSVFEELVKQWDQHKLLTRWLLKLFDYLVRWCTQSLSLFFLGFVSPGVGKERGGISSCSQFTHKLELNSCLFFAGCLSLLVWMEE